MRLSEALLLIREVPDFPSPGILFRDITPLLANGQAFSLVTEELSRSPHKYDSVAGVEARGFILGAAMAQGQRCGFIPIRKSGKLPHLTHSRSYGLEYGSDSLEIHIDAVAQGERVLLVDDVLATGGTLIAAIELLQEVGADIAEIVVLFEIAALDGRRRITERFPEISIRSIVKA
jgi:adenine phosphoribosyltransferase